jgi:hypothetical protein
LLNFIHIPHNQRKEALLRKFMLQGIVMGYDIVGVHIPSGRVQTTSLRILVHADLTKSTDENILSRGKGPLDDLNKGFGDVLRLVSREPNLILYGLDNFGLGQCHGGAQVCLGAMQEKELNDCCKWLTIC